MSTSSMQISSSDKARRKFRGIDAEERQNQRRAQLMEAGLEVFGARGFHASGVREICAQAKLTERYFYESFKNREALFLAVYEATAQRLEQLVIAGLSNITDGRDPARVALRAVLEVFRADPRVARIVLIEVLRGAASDAAFEVSNSFAQTIEKLSVALYPELQGGTHQSRMVANGLYGSTIYIAQRWTLEGFVEPLDVVLEHCALFYDAVAFKLGSLPGKTSAPRVATKKLESAKAAPTRTRTRRRA